LNLNFTTYNTEFDTNGLFSTQYQTPPFLITTGLNPSCTLPCWYPSFEVAGEYLSNGDVSFGLASMIVQPSGSSNPFSTAFQALAINTDGANQHQAQGLGGTCAMAVSGSSGVTPGCWGATVGATDGGAFDDNSYYQDYTLLTGIEADIFSHNSHNGGNAFVATGGTTSIGASNAYVVGNLNTKNSTVVPWGTAFISGEGVATSGLILDAIGDSACTNSDINTLYCPSHDSQPIYLAARDAWNNTVEGEIFEDYAGYLDIYPVNGISLHAAPATSSGDVNLCIASSGAVTKGSTCGSSVLAAKTNVAGVAHGLEWLDQMKPVTYTLKSDGKPYIGFIADDMASIDPRLAEYIDGRLNNLRDRAVLAVAVKALQELQAEVDGLRKEVRK